VDLVLNAQHPHGNVLSKINDGRWDPLVRDMAALDESNTGASPPLAHHHTLCGFCDEIPHHTCPFASPPDRFREVFAWRRTGVDPWATRAADWVSSC